MIKLKNIFVLLLAMIFNMASLAFASELILKSGQKLEGKIIEQTDKYVKFDAGIGVVMTYYIDEIDTIDGQKIEPSLSKVATSATQVQPTVSSSAETEQVKAPANPTSDESNNYVISSVEEKDYTEAMNQYIQGAVHMNPNDSVDVMKNYLMITMKKIKNFQLNYPKSPLSTDANYITYLLVFVGASSRQNFNREHCEEMIRKMETLVQEHPNSMVNHLTIELLRGQSAPEPLIDTVSIPYNSILDWMRGHLTLFSPDFDAQTLIKYFSVYDDNLMSFNECDYKCKQTLAQEVYAGLAVAYMKLNKKDELENLSKEAAERFPDDKELNQQLQAFINNPQ